MSTPPYLDLPAHAGHVELATSRGPLAALRAEPDGTPEGTFVLVPGWTGSKEDFIAVLEPLALRGWTVIAYDQRGQFESPGPDDEDAYSLPSLARDLLEVVAAGTGPVHVVGHSFGGLVAREAVLDPDGSPIASLVLLCSGPAALPASSRERLGALHAALPQVPLEVIYDVKEAADLESGWRPPSPEVGAFMRRRFTATNPVALRALTGTLLDTPDRTDALVARAREGLPVAVMYGPADDAWPLEEQDRVAAALGVEPLVVPGAGHSPAAEAPEETAAALDSLVRRLHPAGQG